MKITESKPKLKVQVSLDRDDIKEAIMRHIEWAWNGSPEGLKALQENGEITFAMDFSAWVSTRNDD